MVLFSGLWSQSLKNGNVWASRQRLQGLFGAKWFEKGVQRQIWNQKSPLLAGLSATTEENSLKPGMVGWSERIRTRAFPIEPGLCVSFPEFGNMAGGVRRRPFAANSGLANGESSEFSQPKPDRHLQRRRRHAAPSLRRPNSNSQLKIPGIFVFLFFAGALSSVGLTV